MFKIDLPHLDATGLAALAASLEAACRRPLAEKLNNPIGSRT
jgi:hypothetical protein